MRIEVDPEKCTGCTVCVKACPENCISGKKQKVHKIDMDRCIKCGSCQEVCKFEAVVIK